MGVNAAEGGVKLAKPQRKAVNACMSRRWEVKPAVLPGLTLNPNSGGGR